MGRTTIFRRMSTQDAVISYIEDGATVRDAARWAGVTRACIYLWLKKGEEGDGDEYVRFYERFNRATGHKQ